MNINQIIRIFSLLLLVGALGTPVHAQVMLSDKSSNVDLGYGIIQNEALSTVSSWTISGDELRQTAAINLAEALYGKLLGLTALNTGGFSGDESFGATLNIRGLQTFGQSGSATTNNDVLILVDGFERPIDRLTVEEVESVTVLKDAAATAMYGHKGVNGVISIITKKGHIGDMQIKIGYSHKYTYGAEFAEMADAFTYASAMNKALQNEGSAPRYTQQVLDLYKSGSDPYFYPNVNWLDLSFKDRGSEDRVNLSIFGGTDKVQYYTMVDYANENGILDAEVNPIYNPQLRYSKANIRANIDFEITPTTKMSVNTLAIFIESRRPYGGSADGLTGGGYSLPANAMPIKTRDGIWGGNETFTTGNLMAAINGTGTSKIHQRQLWANASLTQDLDQWVKGLSFAFGGGYDNRSNLYERKSKSFQYGYEYYRNEVGNKDSANVGIYTAGNANETLSFSYNVESQWRSMNAYAGFYYHTSFLDDDNFNASLLYTARNEVNDGRNNTFNRINWIGNFHYDYKSKYVADLILMANGSNRSYPKKWAFSPVLSLAYLFANDPDNVLSFGKIRGSAGILHSDYLVTSGNHGIWLDDWGAGSGYSMIWGTGYSSSGGVFLARIPTTDFKQQTAAKFNLGTDLRFFNALDFTLEGYYQKRSHIMMEATSLYSSIIGISGGYGDVGAAESYGVEAGIRFAKEISKDMYLNFGGMLTYGKSNITAFSELYTFKNESRIGAPINSVRGLEAIGFFKDQNDIDNSPTQEFSQVRPGDIKYKDTNGDGKINEMDYMHLGISNWPNFNYSFTLGYEYKGVGINALFQGIGDYMKNFRSVTGVWNVVANNYSLSMDYYNNSWDIAGDAALYPRFSSLDVRNNTQTSTVWYQNVHFFKMRNCELYYRFPQEMLSKLHVSGAKLYLQGQNLLSFDNVDAMDAEVLSTSYPMLKAINLGLHIIF